MLEKIAYYIFVLPLSYLPLWVLYLLTDFFFLLLISILPYRKKVIDNNLKNSFPELSLKKRNKIKRKFYRHFTDILAEGVKNLSMSEKAYKKRFKVKNPELISELYDANKNVLLVSGHYNNWEWLITCQDLLFPHQAFGIGKQMTSKFWDKKVNEKRMRLGMRVIHAKNYKEVLKNFTENLKAVLVLSDQSPGDSSKSYWMNFLHQETAVLFGTELMAHQLDYAVVFFITRKIKRGHYEMELQLITQQPKEMNWGDITEAHAKLLEKEIIDAPEFWLWSHKRWKREIPDDLNALKNKQRTYFNEKFNK